MITPTFLDVPLGYVFTILIAFLTPVHLHSSDTCILTHSTHIVTWFSMLFKLQYLSTKDKGGWGGSSAGHRGRADHMRQTARAVQLLPQNSSTHILTHTCCCLGWRDMHIARPDTKRGESSVALVMVTGWCGDRQAPAATPDHVSEAVNYIHFLSLSHTLVHRRMGNGPTQTFHHASLCVCCCDIWRPYSAISEVRSNVLGSQDALRA